MSEFIEHSDREKQYWDDFFHGKPLEKYGKIKILKQWLVSNLEVEHNLQHQEYK